MLTDRQKLLITALYITKKRNIPIDHIHISEMVSDYAKSLSYLKDPLLLYAEMRTCEAYWVASFSNYLLGTLNYDVNYSGLTRWEQYILSQMEMVFAETNGVTGEQKAEFLNFIAFKCGIEDQETFLKWIEQQINITDEYIKYWVKNKSGVGLKHI